MNRDPKISDVLPGGMLDAKASAMAEKMYPSTTPTNFSAADVNHVEAGMKLNQRNLTRRIERAVVLAGGNREIVEAVLKVLTGVDGGGEENFSPAPSQAQKHLGGGPSGHFTAEDAKLVKLNLIHKMGRTDAEQVLQCFGAEHLAKLAPWTLQPPTPPVRPVQINELIPGAGPAVQRFMEKI